MKDDFSPPPQRNEPNLGYEPPPWKRLPGPRAPTSGRPRSRACPWCPSWPGQCRPVAVVSLQRCPEATTLSPFRAVTFLPRGRRQGKVDSSRRGEERKKKNPERRGEQRLTHEALAPNTPPGPHPSTALGHSRGGPGAGFRHTSPRRPQMSSRAVIEALFTTHQERSFGTFEGNARQQALAHPSKGSSRPLLSPSALFRIFGATVDLG